MTARVSRLLLLSVTASSAFVNTAIPAATRLMPELVSARPHASVPSKVAAAHIDNAPRARLGPVVMTDLALGVETIGETVLASIVIIGVIALAAGRGSFSAGAALML